jgi:hypothetical protein
LLRPCWTVVSRGLDAFLCRVAGSVQADVRLEVQGATAYPASAASARVRVANYVPFLEPHGIDLDYTPMLTSQDYSVLVSSAGVLRKAAVVASSIRRARRLRNAGGGLLMVHRLLLMTPFPFVDPPSSLDVYDFDDALTVGSAAAANRGFQWTKQEARRAVACMRRAPLVIAANANLAAEAREYAQRVEVVPSCVDPESQTVHLHNNEDTLCIGWIGSHTTVSYLEPVLPVIRKLSENGLDVRLVVVGGDTGIREDWVEHRPWSLDSQGADLAQFDVGVMPLPDTEWTRGKSGYKLLQYFAAGVPAIASPVGINTELVADGRGIEATSTQSWERALTELLTDPLAREQRGANARRYVEANFSYQRWAPELAALLKTVDK